MLIKKQKKYYHFHTFIAIKLLLFNATALLLASDFYEIATQREINALNQWNEIRWQRRKHAIEANDNLASENSDLSLALRINDTEYSLPLIARGAGDNEGYTAMTPIGILPMTALQHTAIFANDPVVVQAFADRKFDFTLLDCNGCNLLHLLCGADRHWSAIKYCGIRDNFCELVEKFISFKVPPGQCDFDGNSPLAAMAKTYNGLFNFSWFSKPELKKNYDLATVAKNCGTAMDMLIYATDSTHQEIATALSYIRPAIQPLLKPYLGQCTRNKLAFQAFTTPSNDAEKKNPYEMLPATVHAHIVSFLVLPYQLRLTEIRAQNQLQRKQKLEQKESEGKCVKRENPPSSCSIQ